MNRIERSPRPAAQGLLTRYAVLQARAPVFSSSVDKLLDARHLNAFVTISRLGGMRRAGKQLGLTPSALSHALKSLESDLGARLFERSARSLTLSPAGKKFLPEAEALLRQMQAARAAVQGTNDWRRGRLAIGSNSTGCQFILPNIIREFKESFPGLALALVEREADELVARVLDGRLDLAVAPLLRDYRELAQLQLAEDELAFLVHPLHPWARRDRVGRAELQQAERLILPDADSPTFGLIDAYFRQERLPLHAYIEIGNEEVVKQLVGLDLGIGILPAWIAAAEIEAGALVSLPLGRRALRRQWAVFYRKGRTLSFPETLFVGICEAVTRDLIFEASRFRRAEA